MYKTKVGVSKCLLKIGFSHRFLNFAALRPKCCRKKMRWITFRCPYSLDIQSYLLRFGVLRMILGSSHTEPQEVFGPKTIQKTSRTKSFTNLLFTGHVGLAFNSYNVKIQGKFGIFVLIFWSWKLDCLTFSEEISLKSLAKIKRSNSQNAWLIRILSQGTF